MTISKKLYYGFGGMIALVVLVAFVNLLALGRERTARKTTEHSVELMQATSNIRFLLMQNRLYLSNYLLSGDSHEADQLETGVTNLVNAVQDAQKDASEQERIALQRVLEAEKEWHANFAGPLIQKRRQVDSGNATVAELQIYYLQQNPGEWLKRSTDPLQAAEQTTANQFTEQQKSQDSASKYTLTVSLVFAFLAIIGGVVLAILTSKSITEPLKSLIGVTREIGESGDLDQTVDINRDDELGELARTFNSMVIYLKEMAAVSEAIAGGDLTVQVQPRSRRDTLANAFIEMTHGLRSLVRSVRDGASQVASGSNQVASASDESAKINVQAAAAIDEVTSTMHEMSINVQNMVKNTQTQASSVSETSASIDQMVASIQRVADTAKVLLDISQRSREEVHSGISTMEKATDGLNRINVSIQSSAAIIGELGTRADDIGKIIEVIDDLAEQTNLLALNAAIEAARAGEHGLGFAVVADEVRKLAEKSTQSTKEIADLIQSIQREARQAVENMDRSTRIVEEGLSLGNDLGTALHKISNVVTEVYKFSQEIGAATNEQSVGSAQIAKATGRLTEITQEINSAVEEQASGAQAVVRAMDKMRELVQQSASSSTELSAAAEQMLKLSRNLLDSMDRFVLDRSLQNKAKRDFSSGRRGAEQDKAREFEYAEMVRS